jgi:hypothetical protein
MRKGGKGEFLTSNQCFLVATLPHAAIIANSICCIFDLCHMHFQLTRGSSGRRRILFRHFTQRQLHWRRNVLPAGQNRPAAAISGDPGCRCKTALQSAGGPDVDVSRTEEAYWRARQKRSQVRRGGRAFTSLNRGPPLCRF